jgi:hypothetical protein
MQVDFSEQCDEWKKGLMLLTGILQGISCTTKFFSSKVAIIVNLK